MENTPVTTQKIKVFAYSHNFFEDQAWANNKLVCGLDEAGRGALAGPVVVAAVVLPPHATHPLLRDSKTMSAKQRNEAYAWITKKCTYTVIAGSHTLIDTINIYQATKACMQQAFATLLTHHNLAQQTAFVVSDAMPLILNSEHTKQNIEHFHFNYGESISATIAAASIIAKVTRDALMERLGLHFPAYNFAQHKGYGTAEHLARLREHGPSLIHRTTFTHGYQQTVLTPLKQENLFI